MCKTIHFSGLFSTCFLNVVKSLKFLRKIILARFFPAPGGGGGGGYIFLEGHFFVLSVHGKHLILYHSHDDVIKWKYFPRYLPFLRGIHRSPMNPYTKASYTEFDAFFDRCLNKRLSKQSWGWWFEMASRSLWRHCNDPAHELKYGWQDWLEVRME